MSNLPNGTKFRSKDIPDFNQAVKEKQVDLIQVAEEEAGTVGELRTSLKLKFS